MAQLQLIKGESVKTCLVIALSLALLLLALPLSSAQTPEGRMVSARKKEEAARSQEARPAITADDLVAQGKQLYLTASTGNEMARAKGLRQALAKFQAALELAPQHDEALGLAAITAYRLDNQPQALEWFLQRAGLPEQKDSVKAFCYYRAALSLWRLVHDLVARHGELREGKLVFDFPQEARLLAAEQIKRGLDYLAQTLALIPDYPEALNIKNLLHTEAAAIAEDEEAAARERQLALAALRAAVKHYSGKAQSRDEGDFGIPTLRIGEFAPTQAEEGELENPMLRLLEGGRPLKRVAAVFPSIRPPKTKSDPNDPSTTGLTAQGGAYSLGAGRGALTAAYLPGVVKVEVLVSITGKVVFAHVVEGRPDLNGAAILAAKRWTFEPARFEEHPVQLSGVITFHMKP